VFAWWLGLPPDGLEFRGWLDTRSIPFPGEADRTGDSVARIARRDGSHPPWAIALEFQIAPDPLMFGRMLAYLANIWLQVKPDEERGSRYELGAIVVNLTGRGNASRTMHWPAAGLTTQLAIAERNLGEESAEELLSAIESGSRNRTLLPWIPLMIGADDRDIIRRWKQAATLEPNTRRRAEFGGLARIFAEAAGRKSRWDEALKEWNVIESLTVLEWINQGRVEGRVEGQREVLLSILADKFGAVPAELSQSIQQSANHDVLRQWASAAARAATLAEFRAAAGL